MEASAQRRTLGGRYELLGVLGHGGMATVYGARDLALGRTVAVKVLSPGLAADPRLLERFEQEARAAAALNHPNVAQVYDSGQDGGDHFIVMEAVAGETLAALLRRRGTLPIGRAVAIAMDVLTALDVAHEKGIVHSDVSPGNVMLTRDGAVKVLDFGIARALEGGGPAQTTSVLGTAAYLSPEQAAALPFDGRADLYALGCVTYQMLAGRPPFEGGSPLHVAARHVHEAPRPLRELRPEVPPPVEALVLRALSKHPEERHSSAAAMRRALERAVAGGPSGKGDGHQRCGGGPARAAAGPVGAAAGPAGAAATTAASGATGRANGGGGNRGGND
jgi:serine/threonine-protein kinase